MKKNNGLLKRKWVLSLILIVLSLNLVAQTPVISRDYNDYPEAAFTTECATSPYSGCVITLPPAKIGINYVFNVKLLTHIVANETIESYTNTCPGAISPSITLFANDSIITVTIPSGSICNASGTDKFISVTVSIEDEMGGPDSQEFQIPLPRNPIKIALVLDVSGSMSLPTPGDNVDFTPRLDVLKVAVKSFAEKFELSRQPGDSLALSYFTTYVIQPGFPTINNFIGITTSTLEPATDRTSSIIETDMATRTPLYMTALGLGLLDGKLKLRGNVTDPNSAQKIVLVSTDGLQNINPKVNPLDGQSLNDGQKLNDCSPSCSGIDSIKYYTISIGTGLPSQELLENIANNNSGYALQSTVGDFGEFNEFFNTQWEKMLFSSSPQTVSSKVGMLVSGNAHHKFNINKNIKTLIFEIVSNESDSINIEIKKDGLVISPSIIKEDKNHKLIGFFLPVVHDDNNIYSKGEWEVGLTGNTAKQYLISCFADDHFLKYDFKVNKSIFTVGDSIKFSAQLNYAKIPIINNDIKVKALILKPGDDLGNLLATYQTPDSMQLNDVDDPAQQKLQSLLTNDSSFYNALLPKEQIVEFISDENGLYSGSFNQTELTGTYKIIYLINGNIPIYGSIERSRISNAIFVFGSVVEETPEIVDNSTVSTTPVQDTTGTNTHDTTSVSDSKIGKLTILKIRPKNKYGYFMGPGYKSNIHVVINHGRKAIKTASILPLQSSNSEPYITEIRDNLDGSYYIFIAGIAPRTNPIIQIKIRNEVLYQGKVCPVPVWVYILLIILLILLILLRYYKSKNVRIYKIILWIITLLILLLVLLQYYGILKIFC